MASASKFLPPELAHLECRQFLHPWAKNCLAASLNVYTYSVIGSSGYFALLYLFQHLVKLIKKRNRPKLKDTLTTYVRSCLLFGSAVASCYVAFSCFFRNVLGRYYYYTAVFIPACLAGLAVLNETPRNQDLFSTTFTNMALESWISKIRENGAIKWSENDQTLAFMVLTCILSYIYKEAENESRLFWFFAPPTAVSNEEGSSSSSSYCFHDGTCLKNVSTSFVKYFTTGFLLKLLKLVFSNFKKPEKVFRSLFELRTYTFAAFLGFYALVYQSTRCLFYKKSKKYMPVHDLFSGFLSGATYKFQPNIPIFNSAVIAIFQILIDIGCRKKILPILPYHIIFFLISTGYLFHTRLFQPKHCPSLMQYIMSSVTNKKADIISDHFQKLLHQL